LLRESSLGWAVQKCAAFYHFTERKDDMTINEELEKEYKNQRGRPLSFKTPEELENAVNQYFAECEVKEKPKTMSGLALALGIDRRTLVNYSDKEDYFPTIKRARQIVEQQNEEMLVSGKGNATGIIFNMKNNFGWVDKTEQENRVILKQALVEFSDGQSQSNNSD